MELDRKGLLTALTTAAPALSSQALIPKLTKFWFLGSVVQATDGVIGIEVPLKTEFTGGVQGKVLLGFIESLNAETVKVTTDDTSATFSAGRARIKLPLEEIGDFAWPFAASNRVEGEIKVDTEWREALAFAALAVTNNTTTDERRGVSFVPERKNLMLYATDSATLTCATMPLPEEWDAERFVLPGEFIQEMLKVAGKGTGALTVMPRSVEFVNEDEVHVFSKMYDVEKQSDFRSVINRHVPEPPEIDVPEGFKETMERVELLKDSKDGVPAKFTVDDGVIIVEADSAVGDFKEELSFEGEHPDISAKFTPANLLRGLEGRTKISVSKRCVALTGPDHLLYIVSAYSGN